MGKKKGLTRAEWVTYGLFCSTAAAILFSSLRLGLGGKGDLGPGLLPFAASLCILTMSAALVISAWLKKEKDDPAAGPEKIKPEGWLRSGGILVNLALWPVLVGTAGYILSTFLISLGLAKVVGYKDWRQPLILSLSLALGLWLIFGVLFHLDLPSGFSF